MTVDEDCSIFIANCVLLTASFWLRLRRCKESVMTNDDILKIVLESPSLPTLPAVACKLLSISSNEETGMKEIADMVSKDVSLSVKVLKMANSAFYNLPHKVSTIHQAASRLGINAIRSLLLSFSFLSMRTKDKNDTFNYEKFWEQSLANAVAAKLIVTEIVKSDWEEIFIAGLLENIGELILALSFPQEYKQVLLEASGSDEDITELEQHIIGADHAFIGYEVAKNWNFPNILLTPIQYHHRPDSYKGNDKKLRIIVNVIYLSGLITNILYSNKPLKYHQLFRDESGAILGFDDTIIDRILERITTEIRETADAFGFHIENQKSVEQILQEANAALSIINLTYDQMNRELIAAKVQLQKLNKELEESKKHLEKLVQLDSLTGVYNHGYFQVYLENEISLSVRKDTAISLILADVDNFKIFNDTYGHQTGDFILKELCNLMRKSLRSYDVIARYGGEEFAIVLIETTGKDALCVAEKLCQSISSHNFIYNNKTFHVTISCGIAEIRPAVDNFTKNNLIDFADKALFDSKKKGRNSVTLYTYTQKNK